MITHLCDTLDSPAHAEYTLVYARDHFRDTRFDSSLFSEFSYIFTGFSNDDAGFLRGDEGTKSESFSTGSGQSGERFGI